MTTRNPSLIRQARALAAPALFAGTLLVGGLAACEATAGSSPVLTPPSSSAAGAADRARPGSLGEPSPVPTHQGAHGLEEGVVPEGATVFDAHLPAVARLDADLLTALREASKDAGGVGIELRVNSGWRSAAYQERLLEEAVAEHGEDEASRWVATAETSSHVSGDAVDIGGRDAQAWLAEHGPAYGLCRVYRNEPWHYELRPDAPDEGCPAMYDDPTDDPRMQQ